MMAWRIIGVAAAVLAAVGLRWSTAIPLAATNTDAQLRLSLSARPERIEQCRDLSDAELAKLPAHMRLRTQCEGYFARYRLLISVDGEQLYADTLRGGGLRHDRPLHVFREEDVNAGERRLVVELTAIDAGNAPIDSTRARREAADTLLGGRAEREREERARRAAEAMPRRLVLDTVMSIPARRVVLVTFDRDARRLIMRMEP